MKMLKIASIALLSLGMISLAHAEGKTHVIEINRMAFASAPSGIHVGDTVVWRNKDVVPHTATAKSGAFDLTIASGAEAQTVVRTAGSILYFCRFHPGMKSTLNVQP
jgi:plastocyanin